MSSVHYHKASVLSLFRCGLGAVAVCWAASLHAAEPQVIPLWANGAPGFEARRSEPEVINQRTEPEFNTFPVTTNIHNPSVLAYLPAKERATGAAIIVAPGGGHMFLTMGREGTEVGEWLQRQGIAAFVLKYRLSRQENSPYNRDHCIEDGRRAVRLVRSRAKEWGIDPARIGIMGFSAGGRVCLFTALQPQDGVAGAADPIDRLSARPDFMISIYGEVPREGVPVPADAPPAFLVVAGDDTPKVAGLVDLYMKYKQANRPAELHVYNSGGHGFGIAERPYPIAEWPLRLRDWLVDLKMIQKP